VVRRRVRGSTALRNQPTHRRAQDQQPIFRTSATMVTVDAVVVDQTQGTFSS
jgi:hypothetical protein